MLMPAGLAISTVLTDPRWLPSPLWVSGKWPMANDGDISTGNGLFQRTVMVSAQPISTFTPLTMGIEVEPWICHLRVTTSDWQYMPINRTMGLLEWDTANTASNDVLSALDVGIICNGGNITLTRTRAHHK